MKEERQRRREEWREGQRGAGENVTALPPDSHMDGGSPETSGGKSAVCV